VLLGHCPWQASHPRIWPLQLEHKVRVLGPAFSVSGPPRHGVRRTAAGRYGRARLPHACGNPRLRFIVLSRCVVMEPEPVALRNARKECRSLEFLRLSMKRLWACGGIFAF
jgi:hypothetical protein